MPTEFKVKMQIIWARKPDPAIPQAHNAFFDKPFDIAPPTQLASDNASPLSEKPETSASCRDWEFPQIRPSAHQRNEPQRLARVIKIL